MLTLFAPQNSTIRHLTVHGHAYEFQMSAGVWQVIVNGQLRFTPYLSFEAAMDFALAYGRGQ